MSKRTVFTTLTPLPPGPHRNDRSEPSRHRKTPDQTPPNATPEEYHCVWYSLTDRVQYLPGGLASGQVTYTCCFHDLKDGLQTHCYAPMGLDIKGKWTLGGSLPGEPIAPVELGLGAPLHGLWLREDVDMRCNIMMGGFVKKTLKKAHSSLVGRLLVKSQIQEAAAKNKALNDRILSGSFGGSQTSTEYSPSDYDSHSMADGSSSQGNTPSGPQSPFMFPPRDTSSYRSDQAESRTSYDSRLHPAPLSVRNSGISQKGSYPDPAAGGQHPSDRVSWQNLNHRQSPSVGQVEQVYQPQNPYRASPPPPMQYSELPTQRRHDGRQPLRMDGQGQTQGQEQRYQNHGIAELE
ncbi:hypothetical protein BKA65DRAFT_571205 [Rhexocercosporidium sp. MPI-PUGE-AT-0058]|nr:hypothetical protein BKA65DRAFT_571205 [Rhexocercosporidium sp. MPI-PUGE-AT-0058]